MVPAETDVKMAILEVDLNNRLQIHPKEHLQMNNIEKLVDKWRPRRTQCDELLTF